MNRTVTLVAVVIATLLYSTSRPSAAPWAPSGVVVVVGNSLSVAQGDTYNWPGCQHPCSFAWSTWLASMLQTPTLAIVNAAHSGATTAGLIPLAATEVDPQFTAPGLTHVVILWELVNDLCLGTSPEVAITNLTTYVAQRHAVGWTVLVATGIPHAEVCPGVHFDNQRLAVNTQLRHRWNTDVGADGLLDFAAAEPFLVPNAWLVGQPVGAWPSGIGPWPTGPVYLPDQVHLADSGARYIAELVAKDLAARSTVQ